MLWLYLCITIPSLAQVHKYGGWWGVAGYLLVVAALLPALWRIPMSEEVARWLGVATLLAILAAFVWLYPIAKSGTRGLGSDSDDSVNRSVRAMLHGESPYNVRSYLGNAQHLLPGELILMTPFVLLGNSAYANLFWIAAFFAVCCAEFASTRRALLLLWMLLALSPVVMQQIVTGDDQLANGIFTLVFLWLMMRRRSMWYAVLFGLALSSRANFLFLVPLAFPRARREVCLSLAMFVAVTPPFYLADPAHFSPLEAADRLTRLDALLPHLGLLVGVAAVALTLWLSVKGRSLFRDAALVQAFLVITGAALTLDIRYTAYGVFFLFFGALAI